MAIQPTWRRNTGIVGQLLDPVWLGYGSAWDPYYRYSSVILRGNTGDYPLNNDNGYVKNYGYGGVDEHPGLLYDGGSETNKIAIDTSNKMFGDGSIYSSPLTVIDRLYNYEANGTGDIPWEETPSSGEFTFEGWFKSTINTKVVFRSITAGAILVQCLFSNEALGGNNSSFAYSSISDNYNSGTIGTYFNITSNTTIQANTWYHIAWQIKENLFNGAGNYDGYVQIFINGVLDIQQSTGAFGTIQRAGNVFAYNNIFGKYTGYADELRFTHKARYLKNKFLLQKFEHGQSTSTYNTVNKRYEQVGTFDGYYLSNRLILNMDGSNGGAVFTDKSGWSNTVTAVSGAVTDVSEYKYGTSSLNLSAANSRLEIDETNAINSELIIESVCPDLGIGLLCDDFTIEAWVYTNTSGSKLAISTSAYLFDPYMGETTAVAHFDSVYGGPVGTISRNYGNPALGSVLFNKFGTPTISGNTGKFTGGVSTDYEDYVIVQGPGLVANNNPFTFEVSVSFVGNAASGSFMEAPQQNGKYGIFVIFERTSSPSMVQFTARVAGHTIAGVAESFLIGQPVLLSEASLEIFDIAITRDASNNFRFFVNGQLIGASTTINRPIDVDNYRLGSGVLGVEARFDEFRFTHACRYTSNYSVATSPFPSYEGNIANAFVLKQGSTISAIIGAYSKINGSSYIEANNLTIPASEWTHIAWSSFNGTINMFINGQLAGNYANAIRSSSLLRIIGGQHHGGGIDNKFSGYIDDMRVTIGECRYFLNALTPPAAPHMLYPE